MSKDKLYTLHNIVAWLLLCMGLVALLCVGAVACQKESCAETQEEAFVAGKHPIELTAVDLQEIFATPSGTRNTVDNNWDGATTVAVAMLKKVKRYTATSTDGGATVKFSSDDPFYWTDTGYAPPIIVCYPYTESPGQCRLW